MEPVERFICIQNGFFSFCLCCTGRWFVCICRMLVAFSIINIPCECTCTVSACDKKYAARKKSFRFLPSFNCLFGCCYAIYVISVYVYDEMEGTNVHSLRFQKLFTSESDKTECWYTLFWKLFAVFDVETPFAVQMHKNGSSDWFSSFEWT